MDFGETFSQLFAFRNVIDSYHLKVVFLLAIGFSLAAFLGYFAWRFKLSPILAYLLVGYVLGPYSPGFHADTRLSEQLAEIGVILMMFGVGLDFKVKDLLKVKRIAIPGAIAQTVLSALLAAFFLSFFGWAFKTSIILGLSIGVASTVVLVKMLTERHLLKSEEGHIAVGWLIVEDIITVIILLLLPSIPALLEGDFSYQHLFTTLGTIAIKFGVLILILITVGKKIVSYLLMKAVNTRSHELFTISILALIFLTAVATTYFFGISIALGAFISGVVIRQTKVRQKALAHSLPMKDAFIAIFFISVGMLFNPTAIIENFPVFLTVLSIILIAKPVIAIAISLALKYPLKTALTVAVALMQIGEFSFILSEEAMKIGFMTDQGYDIIVACALVSIALNPLIFKLLQTKKQIPKANTVA